MRYSFFLFLVLISPLLQAADVPEDIVIIKENSLSITLKEQQIILDFDVVVLEGFFAYQDKFEVNSNDFKFLELSIDPIVTFYDQTFQKNKKGVQGEAHFSTPIKLLHSKVPDQIELSLVYQACTPEYCLFPTHTGVTYKIPPDQKKILQQSIGPIWLRSSLVLTYFFVFFAGFLTSLTPCVYPMLPITIAVLGANKAKNRLEGFIKSFTYTMGMAFTYSIMGLLAASTNFMFGSLMSNHYFLAVLVTLLFLGALSLFDLFEIQTPYFIRRRLDSGRKTSSSLALALAGCLSGLVVGPCVGPVLVGILGYVSQTGSLIYGFTLLFSFSMGLGALVILLGTFSSLIDKIPRSGTWMVWIKKVMALFFLLLIFYFLKPIFNPRYFSLVILGTLSFFSLLVIFKSYKSPKGAANEIENALFKALFTLSTIAFLIFLSFSSERFERLVGYSHETFASTNWDIYSEEKLKLAKNNNQFVVLDFYADWCAACRELKHNTFSDKEVANFSKNIKWLYFDSTSKSEQLSQLKEKYNILGLPTILFFDNKGNLRDDLRLTGFEGPDLFLKRLRSLTLTNGDSHE